MYKKTMALLLAALLLLSFGACGRKAPASVSEIYEQIDNRDPAAPSDAPETADPVPPDSTGPAPALDWVESEDGQSMTALLPGRNGTQGEVQIGVVQGEAVEDAPESGDASAPTRAPVPAPEVPRSPAPGPITDWTGPDRNTTLEEYEAMSGEEQTLFYYSFANADDFLAWYAEARAASEAGKDYIEIGADGTIDLSQIGN